MKVKDLLKTLLDYNLEANINIVAHHKMHDFTISFGGGCEGETKADCKEVSFYVDKLNTNEIQN